MLPYIENAYRYKHASWLRPFFFFVNLSRFPFGHIWALLGPGRGESHFVRTPHGPPGPSVRSQLKEPTPPLTTNGEDLHA